MSSGLKALVDSISERWERRQSRAERLEKAGPGKLALTPEEMNAMAMAHVDQHVKHARACLAGGVQTGDDYKPGYMAGVTSKDEAIKAVAQYITSTAIEGAQYNPDVLRAMRALGQQRSGNKGWIHEVPDLVAERWAAAEATATGPAQ
jgi:hypothetical protein